MTTSTESRSGRPLYADRLVPLMASAIRPKRVAQLSHPESGATSRQAKLMVSTVKVVAVDGMSPGSQPRSQRLVQKRALRASLVTCANDSFFFD